MKRWELPNEKSRITEFMKKNGPIQVKKDPRHIYCHIKGCRKLGDFQLHPGMQLLCEDHEPSKRFPLSAYIPDSYWQWKDEEEWKELGG